MLSGWTKAQKGQRSRQGSETSGGAYESPTKFRTRLSGGLWPVMPIFLLLVFLGLEEVVTLRVSGSLLVVVAAGCH